MKKKIELPKELHKKDLRSMVYARDVEGFREYGREAVFVNCACPQCNLNYKIPFHFVVYVSESGEMFFRYHHLPRDLSREVGKEDEKYFKLFWKLAYNRFGKLIEEGKTREEQYASNPDFRNETLKVHFEFKTKPSYSYRETLRTADKVVWLNKKSIDYKFKHALNNKEELYVSVVFFYDKGYYVVGILRAHNCDYRFAPYSNDEMYEVPLKYFIPFERFIENRVEDLNL